MTYFKKSGIVLFYLTNMLPCRLLIIKRRTTDSYKNPHEYKKGGLSQPSYFFYKNSTYLFNFPTTIYLLKIQ